MPWKWIELRLSLQTNTLLTAVAPSPFLLDCTLVRKLLWLLRSSVLRVSKSCFQWVSVHVMFASKMHFWNFLPKPCYFKKTRRKPCDGRRVGKTPSCNSARRLLLKSEGSTLQTCSGGIYFCSIPFCFQETTSTNCPKEMLRKCLHEKKTLIVRR